jgi:hypothetical protein
MILLIPLGILVALALRKHPTPLPESFGRVPLLGRFTPLPALAGSVGPLVYRPATVVRSLSVVRQVLAVARLEARDVLRQPLVVFSAGLLAVGLWFISFGPFDGDTDTENYRALTGASPVLMYLGVLGFFGVHLVASRDRRSDVRDQLGATPVSDVVRTVGMLVGASVLGLVALVLELALWAVIVGRDLPLAATPSIAQVLLVPVCCVGAGTLAVMVARWAPWWPAALVVMIALVFTTAAAEEWNIRLWVPYVDIMDWDTAKVDVHANWGWHLAYIAGLDVMAAVGALLRGRVRAVGWLAAGAAAVLFTAFAGVLQYP